MKYYYLIICSFITLSCSNSVVKMYSKSVQNASHPTIYKIDNDLTIINSSNSLLEKKTDDPSYIRVVSLRPDTNYLNTDSGFFKPKTNYPVWVTISPQLKDFFKNNNLKYPHDTLRIRQLMGFPPDKKLGWIIVFWVKMEDLFRPCPDADITDKACQLYFPLDTKYEHFIFIESYRKYSYSNGINSFKNYPWTQLGYTYDWNPQNLTHIGLSEFVIKPGSKTIIECKISNEEYFK